MNADVRPRVLVADDERVMAETLTIILRKKGFDAAAVYDGVEAIGKTRIWKPDLFVSDVVMPGRSSIDAAIRIRAEVPSCRVLLFSGMVVTSDLLRNTRTHGHDFEIFAKPIQPEVLLERLEVPA